MVYVWHSNAGWWEEYYFIIGWHTRFLSSSSHFSKWFASVPEEIKFFGSRISTQIKIFKSLVNLFPFYSCSATTLGQKKKTNAYKPKLSDFFDGIAIPLFETLSLMCESLVTLKSHILLHLLRNAFFFMKTFHIVRSIRGWCADKETE